MIESKRTFGVELEMGIPLNKSSEFVKDAVTKLHEKANKLNWSIGDDISIKDFQAPLEARSPVLSGAEGESNFREFCDYARGLGFRTNATCGTHVHLGGEDFSKREPLQEVTFNEFTDNVFMKGFVPGIIFDLDAYNLLQAYAGNSFNEFVVQANNDDDFSVMCPVGNGKYSRLVRARLYVPELGNEFNIVLKRSKLRKLLGDDDGTMITLGSHVEVEDLIFLSREVKDNISRMRDLFMFYTVFDPVLFAMLPKTRRSQNRFCKPLSYSYSFSNIRQIRSVGQLEKTWYGKNNTMDLVDAKSQYKHESRRHSVNLHSLLGGIGTIEIRLHDGSLETDELVLWIELHQYILERISRGGMIQKGCEMAAQTLDVNGKIKLMIDTINLPTHLIHYVTNQIKKNK